MDQRGRGRGRGPGYRGRGRGGREDSGRGGYSNYNGNSAGFSSGDGTQGGRGNRRPGYNPHEQIIGYKLLETNSTATPSEAILFCCKPSFANLLMDDSFDRKKDWVDLILMTINNAFKADGSLSTYRESLKTVLLFNCSTFLSSTCTTRFINELTSGSGTRIDALVRALENYLDIFYHLCALDPLASKSLMPSVKTVRQMVKGEIADTPSLKVVYDLYGQATGKIEEMERQKEETDRRERIAKRTDRMATERKPLVSFREISVYPTESDLTQMVELRKHLKSGAFKSVEDYLDIQFRLLREDFVSTMRIGIKEFKKNPNLRGAGRFRSGDVKVYENFTILTPNFGSRGITYLVRIDRSDRMFKRINWMSTKRLIYGSLLCLSLDGFHRNNLFATIADRNNDVMTKDGVFEVQFLPESQAQFNELTNQTGPFMAVESMAYFEAYLHVLQGMKNLEEDKFPLSRYIVRAERNIHMPEYARSTDSAYRFITKENEVTQPVALSTSSSSLEDRYHGMGIGYSSADQRWPSAQQLGFNESQYGAFKMALTKEFVVIQGPPGTGKTFIGLKIVEILLYNLYNVPCSDVDNPTTSPDLNQVRADNCPARKLNQMLVVCYTNHALDQFLEGMLRFCPIEDIVRVGSRSKNEALEQCNIRNHRGRRSRQLHHAHLDLKARREQFVSTNNLDEMKKGLQRSHTEILPYYTEGLLDQHGAFLGQLEKLSTSTSDDAMSQWLGCASTASAASAEPHSVEQRDNDIIQYSREDLMYIRATSNLADPDLGPESSWLTMTEIGERKERKQSDGTTGAAADESIDIEGELERELENRMVEDDDENAEFIRRLRQQVFASTTTARPGKLDSQMEVDSEGFQTVKHSKSKSSDPKQEQRIREQLESNDLMGESEIDTLNSWITERDYDITKDLPMSQRWRLYRYIVSEFRKVITQRMRRLQTTYTDLMKLGDDLKKQEDIETLKKAKVIGMTTTGAARMQSVLQQVGPDIVVVEEAAEVLEAHIITALSEHCKHLILIGDHKQLKPSATVFDLAKHYNLDLSLFERMVNNGLPVKTLNIQHRMRPEVSKFMRHIYDRLDDHSSVMGRDPVEGVDKPVFFFNHGHLEASDEMTMSHSNEFEANMVVGLTRYLLKQKTYEAEDITIITMYTGQLLRIKKEMPKAEFQGVKITSVDNFQGEENKIIILSLVRSNKEGKLGFVGVENRVCVSLSRAQYGMYVFGNFDMFAKGSELWRKMVEDAKAAGEFGSALSVSCRRHRNPAVIEKPEDFRTKTPAGGCTRTCSRQLSCGHRCKMMCHTKDLTHEEYKCTEPCAKLLQPCRHPCRRMCHQDCQNCAVSTRKVLPCGHTCEVQCYVLYDVTIHIPCPEPCPEELPCGHPCTERCSVPCTKQCIAKVQRMCSRCGEVKLVDCYLASQRLRSYAGSGMQYSYQCDTPCDMTLACGHKCTGTCYKCETEGHQKCMLPCKQRFPCGHECKKMCQDCSVNGCADCKQSCLLLCSHGKKCSNICSAKCLFHQDDDMVCTWGCEHNKCERKCGEPCSHIPCDEQCDKWLKCSKCKEEYECRALCGDTCMMSACPKCQMPAKIAKVERQLNATITDVTKWIILSDCRHAVPVDYMDNIVYSADLHSTVKCPYIVCKKPVLNTPRYVSRTRPSKQRRTTAQQPSTSSYVAPPAAYIASVPQTGLTSQHLPPTPAPRQQRGTSDAAAPAPTRIPSSAYRD